MNLAFNRSREGGWLEESPGVNSSKRKKWHGGMVRNKSCKNNRREGCVQGERIHFQGTLYMMDTDCHTNKTLKQKAAIYRKVNLLAVQYTCFTRDWYFQYLMLKSPREAVTQEQTRLK